MLKQANIYLIISCFYFAQNIYAQNNFNENLNANFNNSQNFENQENEQGFDNVSNNNVSNNDFSNNNQNSNNFQNNNDFDNNLEENNLQENIGQQALNNQQSFENNLEQSFGSDNSIEEELLGNSDNTSNFNEEDSDSLFEEELEEAGLNAEEQQFNLNNQLSPNQQQEAFSEQQESLSGQQQEFLNGQEAFSGQQEAFSGGEEVFNEELPPNASQNIFANDSQEYVEGQPDNTPANNDFAGARAPGSRRILEPGEAPFEYIVQPGDTLFDICDQFLDSPDYWPMLWAMNPHIHNPHYIDPYTIVRFYPSNNSMPPTMRIIDEDIVAPTDTGGFSSEELNAQMVPELALQVDQKSMNSAAYDDSNLEVLDAEGFPVSDATYSDFIFQGSSFDDDRIHITIPGFIMPNTPETLGIVLGGTEGEQVVGETKQFLIKSTGDNLAPGTTYTILRHHPAKAFSAHLKTGEFYEFVAHVNIDKNLSTDKISVGTVQRQLATGVEPDDIIIAYRATQKTIPSPTDFGTPASTKDVTAIAFETFGATIAGQGNVVFLNKGSESGLQEGQYVKFRAKYGFNASGNYLRDRYPDIETDSYPINVARIIEVNEGTSTAYIMQSTAEMSIGDKIH